MADELTIEAVGLEKAYGEVRVLASVDLRVRRGSVFALLGPNGAGKTTTIRILSTLLRPDRGRASVAGFDIIRDRHKVRASITLTGQYAALDQMQTGEENLRMMGQLSGLPRTLARRRARELLDQFGLADAGKRKVATYSGGMSRRLDLAASLLRWPSVIFLDEPTTGLDPRSRQEMWTIIAGLAADGVTVFLTTQYLEEADRLADRIAVLDGGRKVADGTSAELKRQVAGKRLDLVFGDRPAFAGAAGFLGARAAYRDLEALTIGVSTDGSAAHVRALLDEIDPGRQAVQRFAIHSATLDDVFMALTGRATSTAGATAAAGTVRAAVSEPEEATRA